MKILHLTGAWTHDMLHFDWGLNPRYATLDVHTLIITPLIQLFSVFHDFSYAVEPNIVMVEENGIGGVMVSMLVSSAVDCVFEPRLDQTRDYEIDICFLSAKHTALRRKSKDWLAQNQENVFEWGRDMSIRGLLFQWASTVKIQLSVLI